MTSEITTRTTRNKLKQLQQQQQQASETPVNEPSSKKKPARGAAATAATTSDPTPKSKTNNQTRSPQVKERIRETIRETIKTPEKLKKTNDESMTNQTKIKSSPKQSVLSPTATKTSEKKIEEQKTTTTPQSQKNKSKEITEVTATLDTITSTVIPITPESIKKDEEVAEPKSSENTTSTVDALPVPPPTLKEEVPPTKSTEKEVETSSAELVINKDSDATATTTGLSTFTHESDLHDEAVSSIIKTATTNGGPGGVSRKRSKSIGAIKGNSSKKPKSLSKSLKSKSELTNGDNEAENGEQDFDDDEEDDDDFDSDEEDFDDMDDDEMDEDEENIRAHLSLPVTMVDGELNDENDHKDVLNASETNLNGKMANGESEKLRRRLPMSIKELIDYHSSNGKSIKEIVNKINVVCRPDEKVSYGYVQKYLYRKKLEATTAKKARYYRKKYGFVYRRMRRKPVLTESHRSSRIQWCATHQNDKFDQDIFIGKTALKPFLASLNQLKGQPVDPTQPRTQTTLHLWGAISRKGASPLQIFDGALTTAMYLEILLENVVPFIAENFPDGHRFHQDNNPKHSAKLSQEFLESTGINWVKSPPRSHDLNPIELVWTDLIQVVAKRLPKTIGQVVVAVKEYWKTLTPEKCSEFIDKLVDVVPKVMEKNGEWVSIA